MGVVLNSNFGIVDAGVGAGECFQCQGRCIADCGRAYKEEVIKKRPAPEEEAGPAASADGSGSAATAGVVSGGGGGEPEPESFSTNVPSINTDSSLIPDGDLAAA